VKTFEQVLDSKLAECRELMIRKQRDYGSDNISAWGELGVAVRLTDKVARLRNLLRPGKVPNNESLRDTAVDIANYGLILMMLLDSEWGAPLEEEVQT